VRVAASLAIVAAVFVGVLPQLVDLSEVWRTIRAMTWLETSTLIGAAVWNLMTYWILLVVTVPGLSWVQAMIVTQSSTALANTLPGGPAFGLGLAYSMYSSWGFRRPVIGLALVVSGVGDIFAKLAIPLIALVALALEGRADRGLVVAAGFSAAIIGAGVLALALMFTSDRWAHRIGEWGERVVSVVRGWVGRGPLEGWGEQAARFREETAGLLGGRWLQILAASLVSHLSLFLVLLLALRHVGVSEAQVGWAEALGAFAVVRLVSAIPITPGGLGIVELGLAAALVVAGGPEVEVVAAVLLYRALTYLVQIPFGTVTYLSWKIGQGRRRRRDEAVAVPPA
jgi:putative heme transporter